MIPDGLETLALVRDYLASEVAPALPDHIATEMKAAVKLLDAVSAEFAILGRLLPDEIAGLRSLCQEGLAALGEPDRRPDGNTDTQPFGAANPDANEGVGDLPDLLAERRRLTGLSGVLIGQLQARIASPAERDDARKASCNLLSRFFETLGRQARRRTPWQSVFPHTTAADRRAPAGERSK
jgi:hypothetical protein